MTAPTSNRGRGGYDPFAPADPGFPEKRLRRAGVDDATVGRLRAEYDGMGAEERRDLRRFVTRNPDRRIVDRYQGRRSREELEDLTVDRLLPLLRERNLPTDGRKADLINRLAASYDAPAAPTPTPAAPESPQEPPEAPPGPETPGPAPEAPSAPQEPQETPPETAPQPPAAPTPDAAPAPDTATPADTTTTEEADRG
jgi:hypothetical protein